VAQLKVNQESRGFWAQLARLRRTWMGGALVALVVLAAVFAPVLATADPLDQFRDGLSDIGTPLPPGGRFLLGTDHLGRDVWSRMLYGAQVSLLVSFVSNFTAAVVGTLVGMLAGLWTRF
jgi:peptide/nickel transport system permease protein